MIVSMKLLSFARVLTDSKYILNITMNLLLFMFYVLCKNVHIFFIIYIY